jgi:hypothetical protein
MPLGLADLGGSAGVARWELLAPLWAGAFAEGARRGGPAARRVLRRRLRALGTHPISISVAEGLPVGSLVCLTGIATALPPGRRGLLWANRTREADNVRLLVEEGNDFLLADEAGQTACVIAAGGHLINAAEVAAGQRVSVVGFVDRVADARAPARSANARGELSLAVRSGDHLPLLVRQLSAESDVRAR